MQITFITVGTLKEAYLREALTEYEKRISAYADLRHVEIREEKISDEDNPTQIASALDREAEKILAAVPNGAHVISLCVEGKQYDSPALAELISTASSGSGKLAFIIGSSHGLSPRVKEKSHTRLSVSKMTFPHQLMRVILAEGIYRSLTILAGKRYHK